ncbi:glycerol dehydrogenase [Caldifermentibacillus hisashii]|uniref:Glycerol dehydrogenase n=1 Tax=Caldifermentibacillus hisashii TaxID=996558 RepID=A0ABU9JZG8_9BACI
MADFRAWGSPHRYIQGPNILENISQYTNIFGKKVGFIIDCFFYDEWKNVFQNEYIDPGYDIKIVSFKGEITNCNVKKYVEDFKFFSPDVFVGMGGGKTIDLTKAVASILGKEIIICPTVASTDAPTSAMSIIYSSEGEFEEIVLHKKNPDLVIVDSNIISQAPTRFLISGMGDALSTYFEAKSNQRTNNNNYVWSDIGSFSYTQTGFYIAKACYEILLENGLQAKIAAENHVLTEALENIIECNTLMSGLGFENVGCSIAHAIGNAFTILPNGENMLHGERVAFGVICQLLFESEKEETIEQVVNFCLDIGLPITLEDLNIEATKENLMTIAREAIHADSWKAVPLTITEEKIANYIIAGDAISKYYKNLRHYK